MDDSIIDKVLLEEQVNSNRFFALLIIFKVNETMSSRLPSLLEALGETYKVSVDKLEDLFEKYKRLGIIYKDPTGVLKVKNEAKDDLTIRDLTLKFREAWLGVSAFNVPSKGSLFPSIRFVCRKYGKDKSWNTLMEFIERLRREPDLQKRNALPALVKHIKQPVNKLDVNY